MQQLTISLGSGICTSKNLASLRGHIYIYILTEPRSTRDLWLTQPSPLFFYAKDYSIYLYLLSHYSSLLSYYSLVFFIIYQLLIIFSRDKLASERASPGCCFEIAA